MTQKIILGTVQFSTAYGFHPPPEAPNKEQEAQIIKLARSHGIQEIDTAIAYTGLSNKLSVGPLRDFDDITTKISIPDKLTNTAETFNILRDTFNEWLCTINKTEVSTLLLHGVKNLNRANSFAVQDFFGYLKKVGKIRACGVSVYTLHELQKARNLLSIDSVQIPLNAINQEFLDCKGRLDYTLEGVRVQVRSIFHKGFLLTNLELPITQSKNFSGTKQQFETSCKTHGLTPVELCVNFIKSIEGIDSVVIGANSSLELKETLQAFSINSSKLTASIDFASLKIDDPQLTDIRQWKKHENKC